MCCRCDIVTVRGQSRHRRRSRRSDEQTQNRSRPSPIDAASAEYRPALRSLVIFLHSSTNTFVQLECIVRPQ